MTNLTSPNVWAIVLAWNHYPDTRECIASLLTSTYQPLHIVVVDNGSTDGTTECCRSDFSTVDVVRSPVNLGITRGYNLGVEFALQRGADFVAPMNNDIVVDRYMMSHLVDTAIDLPHAGIVAPAIYYYDDPERIWCAGGRWYPFPALVRLVTALPKRKSRHPVTAFPIEFMPSCCLLIRASAWRQLGGFDPGYFFHYSDWDFSLRTRRLGWDIYLQPAARLLHKVSVSTLKDANPTHWWEIMGEGGARFYQDHFSTRHFCVSTAWIFVALCLRGNPAGGLAYVRGCVKHYKSPTRDTHSETTRASRAMDEANGI